MSDQSPPRPMRPIQTNPRSYATLRTITALILREMSTRYGKTPGGFIWAILEPLGVICILAMTFGLFLRTPALGTSFVLFYASGYLPFSLYQTLSRYVSRSLAFSRPLLFYPSVTWADAILARFILNTLAGAIVTCILLVGMLIFLDTRIVLEVGPIVEAMALAALLGLGIGVLNCALFGLFSTWAIVWPILSRPLFLASGVIFLYEDLPRTLQDVLYYNPLLHIVGILRSGIYPMYDANYTNPAFVIGIGLITLALGLLLLHRFHRDILSNN